MKALRIGLAVVVFIAVAACQPTASNSWQTFTSKEGGFTLLLPGEPQEHKQSVNTVAGSVDYIADITQVGNSAFGAGYSDYPENAMQADPQTMLAGARDGAAKNINGTVTDQKPIELAGHPGLEITVEMPGSANAPGGGIFRAHLYLVGRRLYQVIYVTLKADENPADYQKLFDSFHLDNPPPPSTPLPTISASLKDWITYRSDEGGFTILLPAQPQIIVQPADSAGVTITYTMALVEMSHHGAGVMFNDLPLNTTNRDAEALLKSGRDGAVKGLNGTLISDKPIKLGNYPGTEFVMEAPGNITYIEREYLIKDHLYQVIFYAPKDQIDQFDVQGFFDSFTLLEK